MAETVFLAILGSTVFLLQIDSIFSSRLLHRTLTDKDKNSDKKRESS